MVICPGGSQCIEKKNSLTKKCYLVNNKVINEECEDESECVLGLTCRTSGGTKFNCLRPLRQGLCINSGRNCTREEWCICGENGGQNDCKAIYNPSCRESDTAKRWNNCWKDNNCPLERNMLIAFFIDIFQKETCLGKNCGDIPINYACCSLKSYEGLSYSPVGAYSLYCGNIAGTILPILIGVGLVISQIILVAILITYIVLRNRYKSNYGEY